MKSFKGTIWIFFAVLIISGFTYYFEVVVPEKKDVQEKETTTIVPLKKEQVVFAKWQSSGLDISLERTQEGWNVTAPLKDQGDNDGIESWLNEILEQRFTETAREGGGIDWKTYGLDQPKGTLEIRDSAGKVIRIKVAKSTNFEGKVYLRRDEEEKVLIAENRWQGLTDKKAGDFRDKRLLRGRSVSVDKIQWRRGSQKVELNQREDLWSLEGVKWKLDPDRVKVFLNAIQDSRVAEFVFEGAVTSETLKKLNLREPFAKAQLTLKERNWVADFYKSEDQQYYAYLKETNNFVKLNAIEVEKFGFVDADYFRDHKEPFKLAKIENVKGIQFQSKLKQWKLQLNNSNWSLIDGKMDSEIDQEKIKGLLTKIQGLEASLFLDSKLDKTLESKISLLDEKGVEIQTIKWGPSLKRKIADAEKTIVPVHTALLNEVVGVEESRFISIDANDIFKIKQPGAVPQEVHTQ